MVSIGKESAWKYDTSSSVGGQVSIIVSVGGGKGTITLKHPSGARILFNYVSVGAGAGIGFKVAVGGALEALPSTGQVLITKAFRGNELEINDFVGACIIEEVSASLGGGGSWVAMFLGIPQDKVPLQALNLGPLTPVPSLVNHLFNNPFDSAKAVLVMGGVTVGANYGAGVLGSLGFVWHGHGDAPVDLSPQETYEGPARITTNDDWMIVIPGSVLFNTNEHRIKREAETALHNAGKRIRSLPQHSAIINGHTDSRASDSYNLGLSERRANAVKQWLVGKGYIKDGQVSAYGQGERNPVKPNTSPQNMEQNRRVEILLVRNPPPKSAKLPKDWYLKAFEPRVKLPLFK